MPVQTTAYGLRVRVEIPFEEAIASITARLADVGFGVLTEIDVRDTLQRKLGETFRRYVILGACNPQLAHRALTDELEVGLLLPCNVVVYDAGDGGTVVAAADPDAVLSVVPGAGLREIAADARARLVSALEAVTA